MRCPNDWCLFLICKLLELSYAYIRTAVFETELNQFKEAGGLSSWKQGRLGWFSHVSESQIFVMIVLLWKGKKVTTSRNCILLFRLTLKIKNIPDMEENEKSILKRELINFDIYSPVDSTSIIFYLPQISWVFSSSFTNVF